MRYEERLIAEMRAIGLLVTEAIEEHVYVEVFNSAPGHQFDARALFDECKRAVVRDVKAQTNPREGELE